MIHNKLSVNNIVLVGNFNLSYFDRYFFLKNTIFTDQEITNSSVFNSQTGILISSELVTINITNSQIIIAATLINPDKPYNSELLKLFATKIIESTDLTLNPILAMGINFQYFVAHSSLNMFELSKTLFYTENIPFLKEHFNSSDSAFGFYASTNFKIARLKLDIKPQTYRTTNSEVDDEVVGFSFNYHLDVKPNKNKALMLENLSFYNEYHVHSKDIINNYLNEQ